MTYQEKYRKFKEGVVWAIAGTILLAIFLATGCSEPKTTIGVGSGVTGTGGVGADQAPDTFQQPITRAGPQQCPIFNPVTGALVCSCASLAAGEC